MEMTPLINSCLFNDEDNVKTLLETENVNQNCYNNSPLLYSVLSRNVNIVKLLLDNGSEKDPNALIQACELGLTDIVKLFVEYDFAIIQNILFIATINNHFDTVKYILSFENGKKLINQKSDYFEEIIGYCLDKNPNISDKILKLLIKNGASLNFLLHDYERCILDYARYTNKTIKRMLKLGANINEISDHTNLLTMVILSYQDPNDSNMYHDNSESHVDFIRFIIQSGINLEHIDDDGDTCLNLAIEYKLEDIIRLLLVAGKKLDKNSLHKAIFAGYDILKLLLICDANLNIQDDYDGNTALNLAVENNEFEMAKLIIFQFPDVNIPDNNNLSPLTKAINNNNIEMVKMLKFFGGIYDNDEITNDNQEILNLLDRT